MSSPPVNESREAGTSGDPQDVHDNSLTDGEVKADTGYVSSEEESLDDSPSPAKETPSNNASPKMNPAVKMLFRALNIKDTDHGKVISFIARAGGEVAKVADSKKCRETILKAAPRSFVRGVKKLYKMKGKSGRGSKRRANKPSLSKIMKRMIPIVQSAKADEWGCLLNAVIDVTPFDFRKEWTTLQNEVNMDTDIVFELIGMAVGSKDGCDIKSIGSAMKNVFQSISAGQTTMILNFAQHLMSNSSGSGGLADILASFGMGGGTKSIQSGRSRSGMNAATGLGQTAPRESGNGGLVNIMRSFMGIA